MCYDYISSYIITIYEIRNFETNIKLAFIKRLNT